MIWASLKIQARSRVRIRRKSLFLKIKERQTGVQYLGSLIVESLDQLARFPEVGQLVQETVVRGVS